MNAGKPIKQINTVQLRRESSKVSKRMWNYLAKRQVEDGVKLASEVLISCINDSMYLRELGKEVEKIRRKHRFSTLEETVKFMMENKDA